MEDFKAIARQALADNKHLPAVFVTTDGIPFVDRNSAVNHAHKLDDKTIHPFKRSDFEASSDSSDKKEKAEGGDKVPANTAAGLITEIGLIKDAEGFKAFILPEGEKRKTVLEAYEAKKAELGIKEGE